MFDYKEKTSLKMLAVLFLGFFWGERGMFCVFLGELEDPYKSKINVEETLSILQLMTLFLS